MKTLFTALLMLPILANACARLPEGLQTYVDAGLVTVDHSTHQVDCNLTKATATECEAIYQEFMLFYHRNNKKG